VTSGLDPRSEDEIVALLAGLAHAPEAPRLVLSVTHSLRQAALYDGVAVLYQGRLVFLGRGEALTEYFGIEHHEGVFNRLADHEPAAWAEAWRKNAPVVAEALVEMGEVEPPAPEVSDEPGDDGKEEA